MTKEELIQGLFAIYERQDDPNYDGERNGESDNHHDADTLLLEYANDPEVTRLFEGISKWYS